MWCSNRKKKNTLFFYFHCNFEFLFEHSKLVSFFLSLFFKLIYFNSWFGTGLIGKRQSALMGVDLRDFSFNNTELIPNIILMRSWWAPTSLNHPLHKARKEKFRHFWRFFPSKMRRLCALSFDIAHSNAQKGVNYLLVPLGKGQSWRKPGESSLFQMPKRTLSCNILSWITIF